MELLAKSDAQSAAIERYFNMVYKLALSQTKNVHNAEDIVQNVFLKFLQNSQKLETDDYQKAWLIRVTLNECKNLFSASWFKKNVSLEEERPVVFDTDEKNDVYAAMLSLPSKYRAVIHLFYYEDMTVEEISKALKRSETLIKTQLSRGRDMLRKALKGGYEDV